MWLQQSWILTNCWHRRCLFAVCVIAWLAVCHCVCCCVSHCVSLCLLLCSSSCLLLCASVCFIVCLAVYLIASHHSLATCRSARVSLCVSLCACLSTCLTVLCGKVLEWQPGPLTRVRAVAEAELALRGYQLSRLRCQLGLSAGGVEIAMSEAKLLVLLRASVDAGEAALHAPLCCCACYTAVCSSAVCCMQQFCATAAVPHASSRCCVAWCSAISLARG